MTSRGIWTLAAASLSALVVVTGAGAKTIRGTAGADTIRGTPQADAILGLGGNDRLFGMGGNDRLVGGPGTDRISCGPGRDRVVADARDRIAGDCEFVSRPSPPPPPPPPLPPPPPPPPLPPPSPPSPSGPLAAAGHYVSNTPQGRYVHFDVDADGRTMRNLRVEVNTACHPPAELQSVVTVTGTIAISAARTFTVNASRSDGTLTLTLQGQFDAASNVSGSFRLHRMLVQSGTQYDCDSGTVTFAGRRA